MMHLTVTRELLTLIVESPSEAVQAIECLLRVPFDSEEALAYLAGYKTVVMHRPGYEIRQGGGWYTFEIQVQDNELLIMVLNRTGHWIGDDRIGLPCLTGIHYTHIAQDAHWDPESRTYTATIHVRSHPWRDQTAEQEGRRIAQSSLKDQVRFTRDQIFHHLWEYWRARYASPTQRAVLEQKSIYNRRLHQDDTVVPWHTQLLIEGKVITWQEFREMKG